MPFLLARVAVLSLQFVLPKGLGLLVSAVILYIEAGLLGNGDVADALSLSLGLLDYRRMYV